MNYANCFQASGNFNKKMDNIIIFKDDILTGY